MLAEVVEEIEPLTEIKLGLDLSLVGYRASDIYAKVLKCRQQDDRYLAAVEFTSVSVQGNMNIQQFIHLLIQGSDIK